jgi:hypothetical protein
MRSICLPKVFVFLALGFFPALQPLCADEITRQEALKIAESYVGHHWHSSAKNVLHGRDGRGIEVHTPDQVGGRGFPLQNCWRVDVDNIGVAYKWGGLDTPESFDAGIRAGKAAGDVYTSEKRHLDGDGVSEAAVGIDCSGFICRCWKLKKSYSTYSLGEICAKLPSTAALQSADIMNQSSGHVLLFVKFLDVEKKRAMFYESAPFSKTLASVRDVSELRREGYIPMRYRHISE